ILAIQLLLLLTSHSFGAPLLHDEPPLCLLFHPENNKISITFYACTNSDFSELQWVLVSTEMHRPCPGTTDTPPCLGRGDPCGRPVQKSELQPTDSLYLTFDSTSPTLDSRDERSIYCTSDKGRSLRRRESR